MLNKLKYIITITLILVTCFSVEIHSQNLSGVWSGKYSFNNSVYKYEVELSFDSTSNLYVGTSNTKRTSYDPNNMFPSSKSTYLVAKEKNNVLLISEIAAEPKTNGSSNYAFMVGEFQIVKESNLESLQGFMQYLRQPQLPITLTKTKSEPSEKAKKNILEALKGLNLSIKDYKAINGNNKVYENSTGELSSSVTNSSRLLC